MPISRSGRIALLLAIDVVFFFVELIVGYAVGSLALVADSFHMLNDVMSLVVALYAIKLTAQNSTDSRYSYGWHRAEILAALVNGVFLLALCFSVSLEAIGRFFSTPEISNPRLVVIVGCLGLASNIVGLFLFHEHGHSHGHSHGSSVQSSKTPSIIESTTTGNLSGDVTPTQKTHARRRSRSDSYASLYGHPAATRASLVQTANDLASAQSPPASGRARQVSFDTSGNLTSDVNGSSQDRAQDHLSDFTEETPLLRSPDDSRDDHSPILNEVSPPHDHDHGHSHSHSGSMNMRAVLLHVIGDALGNVGVIATGLIIWLSSWSLKYYCDPIISLVITVIIFSSALPLVRSASFILLQGVPSTISIEDVRASILHVDGVLSLHELHIWQLSESKIVASVHVMASREHEFMPVAAKIRKALHHHGIHSSTIQPEYHNTGDAHHDQRLKTTAETSCLIRCPPDQECDPSENACCPPPTMDV